jgi:uncharacterized membrane protein YgdD (TMEM256/DUF423 family)
VTRLTLTTGALFGLLAVVLGAFGAHGLEAQVAPQLLVVWATASDYLALHALALLALGSLSERRPDSRLLAASAWCLILGTLIFSGSLYARVLTDVRAWGAVTPFGGALLIAGWSVLAFGLWRAFAPR